MSKRVLLPLLLILSLLVAGCQAIPDLLSAIEGISAPTEAAPTETQTAEPTDAPALTATLAEPTATQLPPTETPTATPTDEPEPVFVLQVGNPIYTANFAHPSSGCDWTGIGGQVFDVNVLPLEGLFVIAGDDSGQLWAAQTGLSTAYGPGGYEIQIMDQTADTHQVFWIQIVDESGQPLSEPAFFDTFQDCNRNLVLVNFEQTESDAAPHSVATPEPTAPLEAYP